MKLDESSLTGESDHVRKSADKDPMLLSGKPRPPHKHGWCHDDHFGPEQTKTGCVTVNYRPDNPIYLLYLKFEFSSAVQSFSLSVFHWCVSLMLVVLVRVILYMIIAYRNAQYLSGLCKIQN